MQHPARHCLVRHLQRVGVLLATALLAASTACSQAMAAEISFAPPVIYDKPGAGGLVAADLDGDGNLDIAVGSSSSLSLFYGQGDGTLAPPIDLALGSGINDVKTGDVNDDGLPDLILTQDSRIVVLLNLGNRTYSHVFNYAIGGGPAGVSVADLNGDGKLDLAVSNSATNNMCVLLNRGDGTFAPAVFYPAGSVPGEIISAYLKGDNALDLAIGNIVSSNIQLYFGDGTGKFTVGPSYGVGSYSGQVVADDFNGDGKPDLASSNWMGSSISVLFGDGAGNFGASIFYPGNGYPSKMVSADFDGDGVPDLVTGNGGNSYFTVHQNAGDGNFLPPVIFPSGGSDTRVIAVGDFNGDGLPDVVTSNGGTGNIAVSLNNTPLPTPAIRSLTLDNAAPVGGAQNVTGTVTLTSPAPAGGAVVTISTTNPALTAPAFVTVPVGETTAGFALVTATVPAAQRGAVMVRYNGTAKRVTVTVRAVTVRLAQIDPNPITGGQTAAGQVTAEVPAGPSGFVVALASDHPEHALVPATLTIPAGKTTATFQVITYPSAAATDVVISAGDPGGRTAITLHIADTGLPLPTVTGAATPLVYNPANGHWYQEVIPSQRITWPDAEAAAESVSFAGGRGHLATVTTGAENQFVSAYLSSIGPQGNIWLGALQDRTAPDYSEPAGGWRWVTGEPWGYTSWSGGEPNNAGGGEDSLEGNSLGNWNDVAVLAGDTAYLIEYETTPPVATTGNLLVNGSFEDPHLTAPQYTTALPGWKITRGSVDIVWADSWQQAPGGGSQSLDLVGDSPSPQPSAGTIEQTFATVPGQIYVFAGWMAHNPGIPGPPEGRANVSLNGQPFVQLVHHDAAATTSDMRWVQFAYRFRATAATTTLTIADATYAWDKGGLVLDNLSVKLADASLLVNGSFEAPAGGGFGVGGSGLTDWQILKGTVDILPASYWQSSPDGGQNIDLVGTPGAATIDQSFPTVPGQQYVLSGWISHNPEVKEGRANVLLNDQFFVQLYHSNDLYGAATSANMRWQPFSYTFQAASGTTDLKLTDVTDLWDAGGGAVLDGLTVAPVQLAALSPAPVPPASVGTGAPVYNPANGHWYQVVVPAAPQTWDQVRLAAAALSFDGLPGHLATITSPDEELFVWNTLLQKNAANWSYWMGAYQDGSAPDFSEPAGGWRWVTGEPWSFTNWAPGEPNNTFYNENVLGYWSPEGDHWNDFSGDATAMPYLVEYEAPLPQLAATPLVFTPNPVAGGQAATGQVAITQPAPPGGVRVFLTSDHPSVAAVPVSVTVPAGQTSAAFTVPTIPVSVTTSVVITAGAPTGSGSVTLTVLSSGAPVPNVDGALEPPVYNPANGHWYQETQLGYGLTWQQAKDVAASYSYAGLPGHLVTVTSQDEHNFLLAQLPNRTECWIGLYQDRTAPDYSEPAGGWRWITGEPYSWNDWHGEPNNANGVEDFAVMRGTAGWNDLSATEPRYGFIIEYEAPAAPPAAPTTLAATAASTSQINLSWTDNSDNETGFEIQRQPAGGDWAQLATVPANTQTFADGSLGGGLHFSYRVRALAAGGDSDWSNVATVDVPTVARIGADLKAREFGTLVIGTPSPAQNITLTNTGTAPLVVNSLTLSGTNPADFTVTPSDTTIAPGGMTTISIVFTPAAAGSRSAVLIIDSNAPGGPQSLTLSGTGIGPAGPLMTYTITDLGSLGGTWSHAAAINNEGQVVGSADGSAGPRGFLYDSAGIHDLGTLGGPASYATSLNNQGQIVGYSNIAGNTAVHAVLWDTSGIHDLGALGGSDGEAFAINDAGLIGGGVALKPDGSSAFVVIGGVMQAITTPTDPHSSVKIVSINAAGQALVSELNSGADRYHLYLWQEGKTRNLEILSSQFSVGGGINDAGQIAGLIRAPGARFGRAFLADVAGVHDLGALGGTDSQAYALNNLGQVVGQADIDAAGTSHPFLYTGGVMVDLSRLIQGTAPWEQFVPYGINDRGQIIGDGITGIGTSHSQTHAYLLTPDPAAPFAPPAAPSGLSVKTAATSELDLSWTDNSSNELSFELQVTKAGGDWTGAGTVPANQTSFAHTGLQSYAHYAYRIRAVNGAGVSDWSDEASGDTGIQARAEISPATEIDFGMQPAATSSAAQAVTITNTGNAPMTISGVAVSGANASEFATTGPSATGKTLAPGESGSLALVFTPAGSGECSAVLTITHDGPDSPHAMTLRGTGVGPAARLNPASLDFGRQLVGTTHGSMPVLIQNSGNAPLSIKSVTLAGASAGDFSLAAEGCGGGVLKPGDICSVGVQFTPGSVGSRSASLVILDDAPGGSQIIPLAGEGIAPGLTLSSAQLVFGEQPVGTAGDERSITVTNSGTAPFMIRSGRIGGANAAEFVLLTPLNGITLDPGASRSISCRFAPSSTGDRSATLTLSTDAAPAPVVVKLGGTGIAPLVRLNTSAIEFGEQPVGVPSDPRPLVIRNAGTAPFDIRSVAISGPNGAEFSLVEDGATGTTLNPGAEARLSVRFTAAGSGRRTAVLTLTDSAADGEQTVALGGTGTVASLSLSPSALDFGPQPVGTAGTSQTLLLQNTGDVPLSIISVTLAGAHPADFPIISDGWSGAQLQPGQVVALNVRFSPTAPGARGALLTVLDSATGSPRSVALTGAGTAADAHVDVDSLSFPDQLVGTTSAEQTVTLTNSGSAPLALVAVTVAGANAADFIAALDAGSTTLAPGQSAAVHVRFRPTAAGPRSAGLVITDSSASSPHTIVLSGTGTAPSVTFGISRLNGPGSVSFGNQPLGTPSATQTLTLTNSGSAALTITGISLVGAAAGDYQILADSGPASLAPGASRTLTLGFTPTALGGRSAAVTIRDNAAGGSQSVTLDGVGILPAPGTKGLILPMGAELVAAVDGVPASGPKVIVSVGQTVTLKLLLKYKSGAVADVTADAGSRYAAVPARGKFTGVGTWTVQPSDAGRTTTLTGTWTLPGSRRRFTGSLTVTVRANRKSRR